MYNTKRWIIKIGNSFVTEIEVIGFTKNKTGLVATYKHKTSYTNAKIFVDSGINIHEEIITIAGCLSGTLIEV